MMKQFCWFKNIRYNRKTLRGNIFCTMSTFAIDTFSTFCRYYTLLPEKLVESRIFNCKGAEGSVSSNTADLTLFVVSPFFKTSALFALLAFSIIFHPLLVTLIWPTGTCSTGRRVWEVCDTMEKILPLHVSVHPCGVTGQWVWPT